MANSALPMFYRQPRPLNPEQHANLSLVVAKDYRFAAITNSVPVVAAEFPVACRFFPIVFADGPAPQPVVLLGLRDGENLSVDADGKWTEGVYIPAYVRRYPFIFFENEDKSQYTLCIDEAAPSLASNDENPLFGKDGPTETTKKALEFCREYQGHLASTAEFVAELVAADLLIDNRADISLKNGAKFALGGFKIIDEARFAKLSDAEFLHWRERGWLALIYCHLISISNMATLVERVAARS
jgi:hypothetical protein